MPLYLCALWPWRQPRPGALLCPPPAAWPSLYKIAPSHSTVRQSQTSARERARIARPPITVDTGGGGGCPRPPYKIEGSLGWQNKTQGSAPHIWPRVVPSSTLHLPRHRPRRLQLTAYRSHRTSSARIRPGRWHHTDGWREKEDVQQKSLHGDVF